jgi:pteridine reductase
MNANQQTDPKPVALVTGAAKRVGRAIATALHQRGYRLVIHANSSLDEAQQLANQMSEAGAPAIAVAADLREEAPLRRMVADVRELLGSIDVLVNSAAIWKSKPLEQVTAQDVRAHFEINTLGTFLLCQQVGLTMVAQPNGGSIVNIGDWAVARPYVDYPAYFPSKGAIPTVTRMFAVELGRRNPKIRVNAILPGPVLLPNDLPESERTQAISATLVKREGRPENIAQTVLFFLDNDYVTGVCLPVDGGRTVYAGECVPAD